MRAPNDIDFHLIPGRLRIGVPNLLNNQGLADSVASRLSQYPGVKVSYANPVTGRILVKFDHHRTDLGRLLSLIFSADGKTPPKGTVHLQGKTVDRRSPTQPAGANTQASPNRPSIPWHVLDSSRVLALTQSSLKTGLSRHTAEERLKIFGPNELGGESENPFWRIITESLKGFMTKLLLVAGGVSLLVGETTDAAVIGAIVVIQAVVEAAQGYRAEKSLDKLKQLSDPLTTVLRGGEIKKIASRELVPGDILRLSAGDMVPADAKIASASNLLTNEACLTGESIPVAKDSHIKSDFRTPISDQSNMLFTGTGVIGGQVTAIVVNTGMQTELGRIALLLGDVKSGASKSCG
jgi:Ca2+-transporting ATPase